MILVERSNMVVKGGTTKFYTNECLRRSYLVALMMKAQQSEGEKSDGRSHFKFSVGKIIIPSPL